MARDDLPPVGVAPDDLPLDPLPTVELPTDDLPTDNLSADGVPATVEMHPQEGNRDKDANAAAAGRAVRSDDRRIKHAPVSIAPRVGWVFDVRQVLGVGQVSEVRKVLKVGQVADLPLVQQVSRPAAQGLRPGLHAAGRNRRLR